MAKMEDSRDPNRLEKTAKGGIGSGNTEASNTEVIDGLSTTIRSQRFRQSLASFESA